MADTPPSPTLGRLEIALAALAGIVLALVTSWPLAAHMGSRIAPDLGDPVRTAWQVAWVGHAMLHDPLKLFDSNAFYPHPLSLAFSDSLLGYGPAAFFGSGTVAALVRYNALFLLAWSLCFLGAYLLARELSLGRFAATVAGVAFAYAPYRMTEAGHLHVISSGGIPLALFLLARGYRRRAVGMVLAGWLVSAWQVSLGFSLGLQYCYLLLVTALVLGVGWLRRGMPAVPTRVLAASCAGLVALGAIAAYQSRPYLKVAHDYPTARRTLAEVKRYSAGPVAFLAASPHNRVWGSATAGAREHVRSQTENVLFPGLAIVLLAVGGLIAGAYPRRLRTWLGAGALVSGILALGLGLTSGGYPYRLLYDYAPGFDGVRTPGRIFTLTTLALALLAAAGAQRLMAAIQAKAEGRAVAAQGTPPGGRVEAEGRREAGRRVATQEGDIARARVRAWGLAPGVCAAAVLALLLAEGAGRMPDPRVPRPAAAEIGLPAPILDLPTDSASDRVWQYFSTNGFPKIADGTSTFDIPAQDDLRGGMTHFPDQASVEKLRYYGIRTVVLHLHLPKLPGLNGYASPEPSDAATAAAQSIAGLGITRRRAGGVVIYAIGPGPAALHAGSHDRAGAP